MNKNFLVTKSNYFIKNSSFDLSMEEQRIILVLASMVQPEDKEFKTYSFKISDFIAILSLKDQSKYTQLPKITKELMQKIFEIDDEETGELLQVAWLSAVKYKKNLGEIELEFSPHLKPYLLDLKGFYTQYKLSNILSMKSKYSPRFYELLKMNEYQKKGCIVDIIELRRIFKAENLYKNYNDFKKKIILKAQEELEGYSDIRFEFEEIKEGRRIDSIKFFIFPNVPKSAKRKAKTTKSKTTKELNTEKIIKDQEESIVKAEKINNDVNNRYEAFLKLSGAEQEQLEQKAYSEFLKESESKDNKISRGIFEKTKKSFILKVL